MFGYAADEVISKERVSVFSPGEIVLQNVPVWLEEASREGARYRTKFVRRTVRSSMPAFALPLRLPMARTRNQDGLLRVTEAIGEEVEVPIRWTTKTDPGAGKFYPHAFYFGGGTMPAFIGGAYAYHYLLDGTAAFNWLFFSWRWQDYPTSFGQQCDERLFRCEGRHRRR